MDEHDGARRRLRGERHAHDGAGAKPGKPGDEQAPAVRHGAPARAPSTATAAPENSPSSLALSSRLPNVTRAGAPPRAAPASARSAYTAKAAGPRRPAIARSAGLAASDGPAALPSRASRPSAARGATL